MRHRVRIRFQKKGELRLIGHRDLVRSLERALRRAEAPLSVSEGFHPRVRLSFPLALPLGMEGQDEVLEVEFDRRVDIDRLSDSLRHQLPSGLSLLSLEHLPAGAAKAQAAEVTYELAVPEARHARVADAIRRIWALPHVWVSHPKRSTPLDLRENLLELRLTHGKLRMRQAVARVAQAGPRELLIYLGLAHIERQGHCWTRSEVKLVANHEL